MLLSVAGAASAVGVGFALSSLAPCRPKTNNPSAPPSYVFSIVWTTLYLLQGASLVNSASPVQLLLLLGMFVIEFLWPFLYCMNRRYAFFVLPPLCILSILLALIGDNLWARFTGGVTGVWIVYAMFLGQRDLLE